MHGLTERLPMNNRNQSHLEPSEHINDAKVSVEITGTPIILDNGVLYKIDRLLFPPDFIPIVQDLSHAQMKELARNNMEKLMHFEKTILAEEVSAPKAAPA